MSMDETVSFSLEVNVEPANVELRRLQTLLFRTLNLMRRANLPEDLDRAIAMMERTIATLNQLRLTIAAFYAASGPIGWGLALVALIGTASSAAPVMQDMAQAGRDAVADMRRRGMLPS